MAGIIQYVTSYISKAKTEVAIALLFLKYKMKGSKAYVSYLKPLDAVLVQGGFTFAIWKCSGIYKIEIAGIVELSGKETKVMLPLTQGVSQIEFKFYGIKEIIKRSIQLDTTKIHLKDQAIYTVGLNQEVGYDTALLMKAPADILISDIIKENLKSKVTIINLSGEIHNLGAEIEKTDFKIVLPQFNLNAYQT
jgi:hypothetical protein